MVISEGVKEAWEINEGMNKILLQVSHTPKCSLPKHQITSGQLQDTLPI